MSSLWQCVRDTFGLATSKWFKILTLSMKCPRDVPTLSPFKLRLKRVLILVETCMQLRSKLRTWNVNYPFKIKESQVSCKYVCSCVWETEEFHLHTITHSMWVYLRHRLRIEVSSVDLLSCMKVLWICNIG